MNGILAIVWSPFQLMCLNAALSRLGRSDCDLIILKDTLSDRTNQIELMANKYGYPYQLLGKKGIAQGVSLLLRNFVRSLLPSRQKQYDCMFVGDYRFISIIGSFFHVLKGNARICFLEDGNISIKILSVGLHDAYASKYRMMLRLLCGLRGIKMKEYYTIYSDIKNEEFSLVDISSYLKDKSGQQLSGVYFIGTNTKNYCEFNKIELDYFFEKLRTILLDLRRRYDQVLFIPHGREVLPEVHQICEECGVVYKPLDACFEYYCMQHSIVPKEIYGFSSSTLMSMRCYSDETEIYNCVSDNVLNNETYGLIIDYYEKHGIHTCFF